MFKVIFEGFMVVLGYMVRAKISLWLDSGLGLGNVFCQWRITIKIGKQDGMCVWPSCPLSLPVTTGCDNHYYQMYNDKHSS